MNTHTGAGDRTRTGTVSLPADFESATSANSITPACKCYYTILLQKNQVAIFKNDDTQTFIKASEKNYKNFIYNER